MLTLLLAAQIVPAGTTFPCTPVSVWDGDGPIQCAEGPKIRIAGIAAREIDNSCRAGQPCPGVSGVAARDRLVVLLGGSRGVAADGHVRVAAARMSCRSYGNGKGDRTAAACTLPGGADLGCALIASGVALRWPRYPAPTCDTDDAGSTLRMRSSTRAVRATATTLIEHGVPYGAAAATSVARSHAMSRWSPGRAQRTGASFERRAYGAGVRTRAAISYFANCAMARAAG